MSESLDESMPLPELRRPEPEWGVNLPGPGIFGAIGLIVLFFMIQAPFALPMLLPGLDEGIFPLAFGTFGSLVAATLLTAAWYGRKLRSAVALRGLAWSHACYILMLCPPLAILASTVASGITLGFQALGVPDSLLAPYQVFGQFAEGLRQLAPPLAVALLVFFGGVLPGVSEELLFRGLIGRGLIARWGLVGGIAWTAFLFGVMHFHLVQSLAIVVVGIALHAVYWWSRSLLAPILLHTLNNSGAFLAMLALDNAPPAWMTDTESPPWYLVLAAAACVTAVSCLYYRVRARWILPDGAMWSPGFASAEMPPANLRAGLNHAPANPWLVLSAVATFLTFLGVLIWDLTK